ncbi:MAG: ATP-dependent helicase, partial [Acidobacteria bacterium]|nr:ATP-dependent helicase [Acidobacteriota bacterium]
MAHMGMLLNMPGSENPFEQLNPQQREAVKHGTGPLLVVAGAGTGKTRVITERIRFLLESQPDLEGRNILGLTFTDKAAGEMKYRVIRVLGERAKSVTLSTFHSFCYNEVLLQTNPGLRVLDNVDHWILLRRNMARLGLDHFQRLAEPGQFLTDFVHFFSRCQDELVTPDDYQRWVKQLRERFDREGPQLEATVRAKRQEELAQQEEVARAYRASDELLHERRTVTFGGQLQEAVRELETNHALLELLQERYRYILVDEFQDTNIAQLELLWLLAGGHRNLVVVGDDDQAIYRFRGASFGSFTIFLQRFAGVQACAKEAERHIRLLTQNYRSTQCILRVAGQVIAQNEKSPLLPPKRLSTHKPEGEKVRIVEFGSP